MRWCMLDVWRFPHNVTMSWSCTTYAFYTYHAQSILYFTTHHLAEDCDPAMYLPTISRMLGGPSDNTPAGPVELLSTMWILLRWVCIWYMYIFCCHFFINCFLFYGVRIVLCCFVYSVWFAGIMYLSTYQYFSDLLYSVTHLTTL